MWKTESQRHIARELIRANNQLALIKALAENHIQDAKKAAICCCVEDNTKKNRWEVNRYKNLLENNGFNYLEIPANLAGCLIFEDVSNFRESRYYLGKKEKVMFDKIKRTNKVSMKLLEMGIPYLNSTFLYGIPGTGKTMFGRYVAYKLKVPFAYVNFSYLVSSFMGDTSKNIKRVFEFCKGKPCVLMLDEIDCIGLKRNGESTGADGELARTTISLMQELDQLPNEQIVIAATNREDRIDEALKRRFNQKYEMTTLDENERVEMALKFITDIGTGYNQDRLIEYSRVKRTQAEIIKFATQMVIENILEFEEE